MSGFGATVPLTPSPQQILDEYLARQYTAQMSNVPQPANHYQGMFPVYPVPQATHPISQPAALTGVNRRSIFKQKCRRYVPHNSGPSTEVQTKESLPLDSVNLDPIGQDARSANQSIVKNDPTETIPKKNHFVTPAICVTPDLQGKEKRPSMVTSTPNTVGRRHIFKKKCNKYVPLTLENIPPEVIRSSKPNIDKQFNRDVKKPTGITLESNQKYPHKDKTQNRELIGNVLEKLNKPEFENPNLGPGQKSVRDMLSSKIDDVIQDACEKISVGATTQTIAHLNDEFEKLMQTLQQKGYDIEDKNGSNQKATSPNIAIPDLPEPAKIKYPVEGVKIKMEKPKKKSHHDHLKPSNKQEGRSIDGKVPIGMGYARVPAGLLKNLNWKSYSNCTRKLLAAVFPRRILATHSLTGKPSPAFPDKPAKKMLNPILINDIITTVMDKCDVSESQVRVCVTTKCADESKIFRCHEQKTYNPRDNQKENYPPSSGSDDDDSFYGASE